MKRENSISEFKQATNIIPGGVNSPVRAYKAVGGQPIFIESAKDQYVYDVDGNKYLDFVLTWGPSILGHANDEVIETLYNTAKKGLSFGMPSPLETKLAEKVKHLIPSMEMIRFVSSGTEATMTAIRLARGYTGREKIIKFNGCYHGHHDSLLVKAGSGGATFGVPDSMGVTAGSTKQTLTCEYNNIEEISELIKKGNLAAVIIEPVAGNMGVIVPDKEYMSELRKLCTRYETILIFDEVMAGFRVHPQGGSGLFQITPDLFTFGKVIGGGMPVGAIAGKKGIMEWLAPIGPVYQAGTLSGNPVAMATGLKTLELYEKENVFEKIEKVGEFLSEKLTEICKTHENISFTRVGSMFTLFFRKEAPKMFEEVNECDLDKFGRFFGYMLDKGIVLPPSQYEANFLSLKHSKENITYYCDCLADFLKTDKN